MHINYYRSDPTINELKNLERNAKSFQRRAFLCPDEDEAKLLNHLAQLEWDKAHKITRELKANPTMCLAAIRRIKS